jgi:phospholipid/cholesterol/gamma-HCH transport system substrate-binding protein
MSRRTEIQVGITVLLGIAVLLWGVAFLSGWAKGGDTRIWHVKFAQAGGLAVGNDVQVNGVRAGSIKTMRLEGDHVIADLKVNRDITITSDSRVFVRPIGLMGDRVIAVDYRLSGAILSPADTLTGVYEKGMPEVMAEMGGATGGITAVSAQLDSVAVAMSRNGGMGPTVQHLRRATEDLSLAIQENRASLKSTLSNFAAASATARELTAGREAQLRATMDHFSAAAENLDRLTTRLDSLRASVQVTASRLERGEGSLGKLLNDDKLYAGLNASVRDLQALINDVKAKPKKYFKFSVF